MCLITHQMSPDSWKLHEAVFQYESPHSMNTQQGANRKQGLIKNQKVSLCLLIEISGFHFWAMELKSIKSYVAIEGFQTISHKHS